MILLDGKIEVKSILLMLQFWQIFRISIIIVDKVDTAIIASLLCSYFSNVIFMADLGVLTQHSETILRECFLP